MAQPNVAREPSMEEILASIRRIIESNEPTADSPQPHLMPVDFEDEIEQEEQGFTPDIVANDRGLPTRDEPMDFSSHNAQAPAGAERSLSLADVAARVRAASARQQEASSARAAAAAPVAAAPVAQPEEPAIAPRMPEFRMPEPAPAPRAEQVSAPAQQYPSRAEQVSAAQAPAVEPRQSMPPRHEPELRQEVRPSQDAARSLPAKIEETASLLSQEAGAHVARSFSELAAVFNGMERRSLEDMAQDMLRPMLQEWLDDNLPTLVERLVREEIERVARGPRR
nr:DUF2497 domain-containing protein [Neorhizobium turbinariae]